MTATGRAAHACVPLLLFAAALLAAPPVVEASSRAERRVTVSDATAAERAVFADVRDDRLDEHDGVTAALASSSLDAKRRTAAGHAWSRFLKEAGKLDTAEAPARAGMLLRLLHREILKTYAFGENDVGTTLLEGRYNCVTATILYQAAGRSIGLDVRGVIVPTHVHARVVVKGEVFDVETTSPEGFQLARDDKAYRAFLKRMQLDNERRFGVRIRDEEPFFRREIDEIDLVSVLYANRGGAAVKRRDTRSAISLFARAALLAKDERYARDTRDLLLAQAAEAAIVAGNLAEARRLFEFALKDPGGDPTIMERLKRSVAYCWSLEGHGHVERRQFSAASAAFDEAARWDDDPGNHQNRRATFSAWGLQELEAKRYAQAVEVFARGQRTFPADPVFPQNLKAAYFEWTQDRIAAGDCTAAFDVARRMRRALDGGDPDIGRIFEGTAIRCADAPLAAGQPDKAVQMLETALAEHPTGQDLRGRLSMVLTNQGVDAARAGRNDEAERYWRKAIAVDPNATIARENLRRIGR